MLHVADQRPRAPRYQRLLDELNHATVAAFAGAGWRPELVATEGADRDDILARDPAALPGATSNHCYFCWYVLTRGLANGVGGGGGQVGGWTGSRPNYAGELIQLGVRRG